MKTSHNLRIIVVKTSGLNDLVRMAANTDVTDEAPMGKKLVRGMSLLDATMIVVGSMIGRGIFITSAESARLVGSPG